VENEQYDLNEEQNKKSHGGMMVFLGILLGILLTFFLLYMLYFAFRLKGIDLFGTLSKITGNTSSTDSELLSDSVVQKLQGLEQAIDTYYYKTDVDKSEEADGLYKGLLDSLGDPYSVYYTEEEYQELVSDTEGTYSGIGAYVSMDNDIEMPRISGFIEGSPAEEAGVQVDDIIYEVEGESTQGLELSVVVSKIKGEEGTTVHIKFYRQSTGEYPEFDIERKTIESPTVSTEMKDNNIGYLRITEFDTVTYDQFIEGYTDLQEQGMEALILDLRSNPGGSLSVVCDIARQLLPEGTIVYTVDRDGNREDYECDGKNEIQIPVVVLVNGYSASASEILSGALKDYNKATLIGTTTYGKGVVQRIFNFTDGTAIKLTISNYYTPNGNDINGVGIEPDEVLELDAEAYAEDGTDNQLDRAIEVLTEELGK
jgi:carboxyl-terminal processing protease